MARYEKYKDGGIQWLGDVPAHWKDVPISALFSEFSDKGHPDYKVLSVYREYGVIEKDSRDDNHNVTSEKTEGYKAVSVGDFVINKMKAWQGSMGVSEYKGIVSPAYITCRFRNDNENRKFIHHLLRSQTYINHYNRLSDGVRVGQWDMHFEDFKRLRVFLPPREEQDLIVQYIELSLAEIDKAIAQQQRMIVLLNERKQIIIQNAVTKGLDPNVPMKDSGVDYIGNIPANWEIRTIKQIGRLKGGDGFPVELQGRFHEHIKFIKVNSLGSNISLENDYDSVSYSDIKIHNYSVFNKGDVVFAKVGAALLLQRFCILPFESCIDNNMMAFYKSTVNNKWFCYVASRLIDFKKMVNMGPVPSINQSQVGAIRLPLPPLFEQNIIAEHLDNEVSRIDSLIKRRNDIIRQLQERKRIIINDVVTGKIKVL